MPHGSYGPDNSRICEGVMHARICLEHTVSTNSVTVTFKAKPIAAANIIVHRTR